MGVSVRVPSQRQNQEERLIYLLQVLVYRIVGAGHTPQIYGAALRRGRQRLSGMN